MAPLLIKWPSRMLFAACVAVGVVALAAMEEHADLAYLASHDAESFLAPVGVGRQKRGAKAMETRDGRPSTGCPNLLVRHDDKLLLFRDDALVARFASLEDYQAYAKEQREKAREREKEAAELAKEEDEKEEEEGGRQRKRPATGGACPVLYVEPEPDAGGVRSRRWRRRDAHQRARDRGTVRGLSAAFWDWQQLGAKPTDRPLAAAVPTEPAPEVKDLTGVRPYNEHHMDRWLRPDLVEAAKRAREKMGAVSDNPMDPHWGGVRFSQQAIDSGKYDAHTIFRPAK